MTRTHERSRGGGAANPVQAAFMAFPVACFTLALLSDLAFWGSGGHLFWQTASAWLLFAGLIGGGLAILAWLVGQALHPARPSWLVALLCVLVLVAAFLDSLVHAVDGWTGVVPWGITLSALCVLLMLAAAVIDGLARR